MHTVAIVPPPDDSPDAPAGVLTGSEDGFVLRAAAREELGVGAFFDPAEVGAHVGGAAVRAIALIPDVPGGGLDVPPASDAGSSSSSDPSSDPPSYILLTAGAKEVLHAWRVSWERASAPGSGSAWRLRTSLVATRGSLVKAGHAEWTKGCGFVAASVESDQRYMDVAGFVPVAGGGAVALVASSEGAVSAMALERRDATLSREGVPGRERTFSFRSSSKTSVAWRAFADLRFHDRPVLAVDVAGVRVAGGGEKKKVAVVAATGATDGALAIWDMSDALPETSSKTSSSSIRTIHPCHVSRGAHQSGVNGVAVRAVGGDAVGVFVAASGGDDQVARAEVFAVKPASVTEATKTRSANGFAKGETSTFRVVSVARVAVAFAHSSAIKGVWLGPGTLPGTLTLATASHDQRARVWTASVEAKDDGDASSAAIFLTPVAGAFAECPEPEGLDGFVDARGRTRIAVCGRGVQMFELE